MNNFNMLNRFDKKGTALLMTILILNSIILISLAASKVVVSGVKMGGTQAQSTKAYFSAEAGAERLLWEYRKGHGGGCNVTSEANCDFSKTLPNNSSYVAKYEPLPIITFISVGSFGGLKRSVQLTFKY